MILTGRAKDDFLSWYGTGEHYFTVTLKHVEQYANIVKWLDGEGIYIELSGINDNKTKPIFTYNIQEYGTINGNNGHEFETRQQAIEAAIKLADETYNENTTLNT